MTEQLKTIFVTKEGEQIELKMPNSLDDIPALEFEFDKETTAKADAMFSALSEPTELEFEFEANREWEERLEAKRKYMRRIYEARKVIERIIRDLIKRSVARAMK